MGVDKNKTTQSCDFKRAARRAPSLRGRSVQIATLRRELAASKRQEVLAIAKAEGLKREVRFEIPHTILSITRYS